MSVSAWEMREKFVAMKMKHRKIVDQIRDDHADIRLGGGGGSTGFSVCVCFCFSGESH